jgi:hypothetical protein
VAVISVGCTSILFKADVIPETGVNPGARIQSIYVVSDNELSLRYEGYNYDEEFLKDLCVDFEKRAIKCQAAALDPYSLTELTKELQSKAKSEGYTHLLTLDLTVLYTGSFNSPAEVLYSKKYDAEYEVKLHDLKNGKIVYFARMTIKLARVSKVAEQVSKNILKSLEERKFIH